MTRTRGDRQAFKNEDLVLKVSQNIDPAVWEDAEIADPSPENQKKFEYARDHFDRLNKWLKRDGVAVEYQLNFLTPKDFNKFFIKLRKDEAKGFRSELDVVLAQQPTPNGKKGV